MRKFQLAIIGFGTVGEGVYTTLMKKQSKLKTLIGGPIHVPFVLVKTLGKHRNVQEGTKITNQFNELLTDGNLDVVVEATPDAETAYPYVSELLTRGVSIITANKELVATYGPQLQKIAEKNKCHLLYEATVAGGIPLLNTLRHTMKMNTVNRLEGILNGTSNFMLTKMREGATPFHEALSEAQEKGYAETIPDKDVDGWDAYFKTAILSRWIYGKDPIFTFKKPKGIRNVSVEDIAIADELKGRIKHVASLEKVGESIRASVEPCLVLPDHPLYGVEGVNNGVHIEGSIVGSVMLQGPGAGMYPTASAIVEDLVNLLLGKQEEELQAGLEFLGHGFDVEEIDDSQRNAKLYYINGNEAILGKRLSSIGAHVVEKTAPYYKRTGILIYLDTDGLQGLNLLSGDFHVYPVLTNKPLPVESLHLKKGEAKQSVSF